MLDRAGRRSYRPDQLTVTHGSSRSARFERASKLAIALDYALNHEGTYPSGAYFRAYGHNIADLLNSVAEIVDRRALELTHGGLPQTNIHRAIIATLSDFANNVNRYYNLEVLGTGGHDTRTQDPIAAWHRHVTTEVLKQHYTQTQREREEIEVAFGDAMMGDRISVRHVDETGAVMDSLADAIRAMRRANAARPWERMYVLQIGRFLGSALGQLGFVARAHGMVLPELREFFAIFNQDDACLRRLKLWTISS